MRQVHTDLVGPAGARNGTHDSELIFPSGAPPNESLFHSKLCQRRRAFWMDRLFQPNGGCSDPPLARKRRI